jgi:hypothetical protein
LRPGRLAPLPRPPPPPPVMVAKPRLVIELLPPSLPALAPVTPAPPSPMVTTYVEPGVSTLDVLCSRPPAPPPPPPYWLLAVPPPAPPAATTRTSETYGPPSDVNDSICVLVECRIGRRNLPSSYRMTPPDQRNA